MNPETLSAALFFVTDSDISRVEPFGRGNINDTFLVTLKKGEQRVLQRISPNVFPDPQLIHENICHVSWHLVREIQNSPDLAKEFFPLHMFKGKDGDTYAEESGAVWRMASFINGQTLDTINSPIHAKELGRCLGVFHRLLSTFDPSCLHDTLPGFHDTALYLSKYDSACAKFNNGNHPELKFFHSFIAARRDLTTLLGETKGLRRSVIHGDPKVANFIFDESCHRAVSLIDLDTVRPGLLLHDIGDGLRSCCNPAGESPSEPELVEFDQNLFAAWLKGYNKEAGMLLTDKDKTHIVVAIKLISFELGLRFLTDYMAGNIYFKTDHPEHNLNRAMVQFRLVQSLEEHGHELEPIVQSIFA